MSWYAPTPSQKMLVFRFRVLRAATWARTVFWLTDALTKPRWKRRVNVLVAPTPEFSRTRPLRLPVKAPSPRVPPVSTATPTRRQKAAFWLLTGMISVVCVEVPAGSSMFPFFTVWGVAVVLPLYLLHSVFLAALVFHFGRPRFWPLFAAGMLYGMYEAYITKVAWTSFIPTGPPWRLGGVAAMEMLILVLFIHALLAFIVPLFMTELMLTRSRELEQNLPAKVQIVLRRHPRACLLSLMAFLGLMQFVNSPSPLHSLASGGGNSLVIALGVWLWRRTGGDRFTLRELLPTLKGTLWFEVALLAFYVFWGSAIKAQSLPGVWEGQLTVWVLYAILFVIFWLALRRSRAEPPLPESPPGLAFSWQWFVFACATATLVTTAARWLLHPYAMVQIAIFFTFYALVGVFLLAGTLRYVASAGARRGPA